VEDPVEGLLDLFWLVAPDQAGHSGSPLDMGGLEALVVGGTLDPVLANR